MLENQTIPRPIPPMSTETEVLAAIDEAFDYRGDVTLTLRDGSSVEGYLFDRQATGKTLTECTLKILPSDGGPQQTFTYAQVARIQFAQRDPAAGMSFSTWMKKWAEKKAAGETNIGLDPEVLD